VVQTKEKCKEGLTKSLERTAAPLRSSRVAGFDDTFWLSEVTGVVTAGRLSLSSDVELNRFAGRAAASSEDSMFF